MRITTLAILGLLAGTAGATPPCECAPSYSVPAYSATNAPRNARLSLSSTALPHDRLQLIDVGSGTVVPASVIDLGGGSPAVQIVPDAPLSPGVTYGLHDRDDTDPIRTSTSFTVTDTIDSGAPSLTTVSITGDTLSGACDDVLVARVTTTGLDDDLDGEILLEVRITDGTREFVSLVPAGQPLIVDTLASDTTCDASGADGLAPNQMYTATVRAIDAAGNASAPVTSAPFMFQRQDGVDYGFGCAVGGKTSSLPWAGALALVLAWLVLRRRSRA